jgi:hypothetical protein
MSFGLYFVEKQWILDYFLLSPVEGSVGWPQCVCENFRDGHQYKVVLWILNCILVSQPFGYSVTFWSIAKPTEKYTK